MEPNEPLPWHLDALQRGAVAGGQAWRFIDRGGAGRAVVLLPGALGTCELFYRQLDLLPPKLRVIAATYPAETDAARLADGLAALLGQLGIARAAIAGSSFAGYWGQVFALRHPAMTERLFIANSFTGGAALRGDAMFDPDWIARTPAREIQEAWRARLQAAPDSVLKRLQMDMLDGRQDAETLKSRFMGIARATPCPALPIPPAHVRIIETQDDPVVPPAARAALRGHYPDAVVHSLEFGGHYAHIANAEAYAAAIVEGLG